MKEHTKLVAVGRPHDRPVHPVNHPVERASTLLFPTYDDFLEGARQISYGRLGTSNHRALEEAINVLEGGYETRLAPSGLQACIAAILAFVKTGDTVLMTDSVYDPTRKFAARFLERFGVNTVFYDPLASDHIADFISPETRVIFAESPGSLTFEVQDLPALARAAHDAGAVLIVDNTWSAGVYCKPIALGADVSVQACTKYLCGHADCLVGSITAADEASAKAIFMSLLQLGSNVSADDAYLTLRGMRTLSARLPVHQENGLKLARWLQKRPEIERVIHPAFKTCPGHAVWKRDFTGSTGLFAAVLKETNPDQIRRFFNAFKLFGMGFSWGGFESLCIHVRPEKNRSATKWEVPGTLLRIHAGLEDIDDLIVDFERALAVLKPKKDGSS